MGFFDRVSPLSTDETTPLYLQLQTVLRGAIEGQVVARDEAIPTERELAEAFGVSRITVRKAVDGLVSEGLVTRRQGAGTFVQGVRVEKYVSRLTSFSQDMAMRGMNPGSEWLVKQVARVNPEEALSLGLSPNAEVYRFHRIRLANGESMALEYSTIPAYCLPSIDSVGKSLYAALEVSGYLPVRVLQRLRAISFNKEQATLLNISPGDPGLFFERRGFLPDGRAAEFTQSFYRGDSYDMISELAL